jgi:hypothetical protein
MEDEFVNLSLQDPHNDRNKTDTNTIIKNRIDLNLNI